MEASKQKALKLIDLFKPLFEGLGLHPDLVMIKSKEAANIYFQETFNSGNISINDSLAFLREVKKDLNEM